MTDLNLSGPDSQPDALRAVGIAKSYGTITALRGVDLHVKPGEVLGLIGDNGAGKSTLIKILTGYHRATSGDLFIHGQRTQLQSVKHARELGIETVFQDLALIDTLPVYMNLHLNKELTVGPFLRKNLMRMRARRYLDDIGINIPSVNVDVSMLSGGQRQAIAVARSVYSNATTILLDEPLAAMGVKEGGIILDLIQRLRERRDVAIILIVHNYAQVFDVCDRVNLLQGGKITFDKRTNDTSIEELLHLVTNPYRNGRPGSSYGQELDSLRA
ncbi:sugar ABC transporter ATP-binding protein [Rhizobium sp. NLR17b]|uniref:ATP-binding cassette domain-containing protein n=1 Tax=Rhizobium sp. NLR17b TaxID=2731114 RepID=UPI001C8313D4|nr:ATP-binding cassette domain-containing protein [Rhizobium sp. NLR17b]MBX5272671.1 sugar ABC transporter ATP-binding protein [Rhizobium sp. NLR17b]